MLQLRIESIKWELPDVATFFLKETSGKTVPYKAGQFITLVFNHHDEEIRRFEYKVEAGAEYAVTQPVFDLALLESFLKRIEHHRIPVVAGIWPLVSVRNTEFMKNELRVSVPDAIVERMAKAATPEGMAGYGRVGRLGRVGG